MAKEQKKITAKVEKPKKEAQKSVSEPKVKATSIKLPAVEELLEAGVQFGHETKRWSPKMSNYIYTDKDGIHIIDVTKSLEMLEKATKFLVDAASRGEIIFVATKKQSSEIIKNEAVRAGAHFIDQRWAGGLLTNFEIVKKSLNKLKALERSFEEGVEGRTKYEVSQMKKEWQRLDRLYAGVKTISTKPTAVVVFDSKFEKGAIREARKLRIPIVGLVDTNTNPDLIDYLVPSNDDAVAAISLMAKVFADAVLAGNKGNGVKHVFKDYAKMEVKIAKDDEDSEEEERGKALDSAGGVLDQKVVKVQSTSKVVKSTTKAKGILERVQEAKEKKSK